MRQKPTAQESGQQAPSGEKSNLPLREIVREALLSILADKQAPAAAKASASRTILEYFTNSESHGVSGKRSAEMSLDELNAEIAAIESKK